MSSLCRKNEKQGGIVNLPQWKFQICKFKSKKNTSIVLKNSGKTLNYSLGLKLCRVHEF